MAKLRQRVAGAHDAHPIAAGLVVIATATLALAEVLVRSSDMVFNVNFVSVRQALTPDRLQGRVGATIRALTYGVVPLGALVGGQLGGAIGLRGTVLVGAAGVLLAFLWVALSPVRALDTFPMVPESPVPDEPYVGANRVLLTSRYGFSGTLDAAGECAMRLRRESATAWRARCDGGRVKDYLTCRRTHHVPVDGADWPGT